MKRIFIISIATLLSACGATGDQFTGFTNAEEGSAKIYVYRPWSSFGGGMHYDVKADGNVIGHIRNGGYFEKELTPGSHTISAKTEVERKVNILLRENQIQCIKVGVRMGVMIGRPSLKTVDMKTCQEEIKKTKTSTR